MPISSSINAATSGMQNVPPAGNTDRPKTTGGMSLAAKIMVVAIAILLPVAAFAAFGMISGIATAVLSLAGAIVLIAKCGPATQQTAQRIQQTTAKPPQQASQQQFAKTLDASEKVETKATSPDTEAQNKSDSDLLPSSVAPQSKEEQLYEEFLAATSKPKADPTAWLNEQCMSDSEFDAFLPLMTPQNVADTALANVFGFKNLMNMKNIVHGAARKSSARTEYAFRRMSQDQLKAWISSLLHRPGEVYSKINPNLTCTNQTEFSLTMICEFSQAIVATRINDELYNDLMLWLLQESFRNSNQFYLRNLDDSIKWLTRWHQMSHRGGRAYECQLGILALTETCFIEKLRAALDVSECEAVIKQFSEGRKPTLFDEIRKSPSLSTELSDRAQDLLTECLLDGQGRDLTHITYLVSNLKDPKRAAAIFKKMAKRNEMNISALLAVCPKASRHAIENEMTAAEKTEHHEEIHELDLAGV